MAQFLHKVEVASKILLHGTMLPLFLSMAIQTDTIAQPPLAQETAPLLHLRIEPSQGWVSLRLNELWDYRELLYFLTWRNIKVRYKQTALWYKNDVVT